MSQPVKCRCGRDPERNTLLAGYRYSLSCKCGGSEIEFAVRADTEIVCIDNWDSKITGAPYKHSVQEVSRPDGAVSHVPYRPAPDLDICPLRRYYRARGGFVSGGPGPS